VKSFVRNTLTSVFTTALDFVTLVALVELAGVHYVFATFCGTVVGATSNFFINRHWSFEASGGRAHWQMVRFLPVQAGSSALHTLGVWFLTDVGSLPYFDSKVAVSIVVYLIWNYPMNRNFVFREADWLSPPQRPTMSRPIDRS
jgi:putative flippase GtrA